MNKLKDLLTGYVDCYRKYFVGTIGVSLAYTVLCFIGITLLLKYSNFDNTVIRPQVSLVSYLITRYSSKNIYSLVDLAQSVLFFFIALFSVSLYRIRGKETPGEDPELSLGAFVRALRLKDLLLLAMLLPCIGIDYGLFRLNSFADTHITKHGFLSWVDFMLFLLRVYCPMFLFAVTQYALAAGKMNAGFKKMMFLLFSLWLMYVLSFEMIVYIRRILFGLFMAPLDEKKQYYVESILAIPLIAFFFVGFHAAMTEPLRIMEGSRKKGELQK